MKNLREAPTGRTEIANKPSPAVKSDILFFKGGTELTTFVYR